MEFITLLVTAISSIFLVSGVIMLMFKKMRETGKAIAGYAVFFLIGATIMTGIYKDDWAQNRGFESAADEQAAKDAGIVDPKAWGAAKEKLAQELEAKRIAEAKERDQRDATARDAGFIDSEDHQKAKDAGFDGISEWKAYKQFKAYEKTSEDIKKITKEIEYVAINDLSTGATVFAKIKSPALTGGNLDFVSISNNAQKVAEFIKINNLNYNLDISIIIPTIDKYGNHDTSAGGGIYWESSDLMKLKQGAPSEIFLKLAKKVSLTAYGKILSIDYCSKHDLNDRRYCR